MLLQWHMKLIVGTSFHPTNQKQSAAVIAIFCVNLKVHISFHSKENHRLKKRISNNCQLLDVSKSTRYTPQSVPISKYLCIQLESPSTNQRQSDGSATLLYHRCVKPVQTTSLVQHHFPSEQFQNNFHTLVNNQKVIPQIWDGGWWTAFWNNVHWTDEITIWSQH